ncbi:MAG TPA: glycine cleavage T C-terminal barrel domain-containing protein [Pyrinomonadaceae bacterium]|jgi:folate-binding protein YgfZ|nr:glycine cleavage T C-terminal barrel domain-containing protein [Pyrinomonadaceae bacterium]
MKETMATGSEMMAEYAAVRDGGVGLIDLSARGRISVSGSEAVMFLNGLISNDLKTLEENRWMPAAFPNVQGRLLAAVRVVRRAEDILLDTEAVTREKVIKIIERFTLAGDFKVKDLTDESAMISVQGGRASELVEKITYPELTILPATHTAEAGFDLIVEGNQKANLWQSLVDAGATPVSERVEEILRIEAGIARYGVDMDETNVVTETNLDDAVSFTKGCYLGQEIIIRIKHRGHVAKKLTGLRFETEGEIEPGAVIKSSDDKEIGRVTSSTFSPRLRTTVALGYVRYEHLTPGTRLLVDGAGAETAELPLVRGSWSHE